MGEVFKLNHCYNVDCVPAMELFPDNYFDLAVVDPPYFSGPERRGFYGSKVSKIGVHRDYPISPAWIRPGPEYFRELLRVSRHYIVWGCNYFDYKFATGRIVWDKCNGSSSFSDCEIAATDLFTSVRLFRYMWSGMMQGKSIAEGSTMQGNKSMNEKRIHPTQKPVVLYDWIFNCCLPCRQGGGGGRQQLHGASGQYGCLRLPDRRGSQQLPESTGNHPQQHRHPVRQEVRQDRGRMRQVDG